MFQGLAVACVIASVMVYSLVPKYQVNSNGESLAQQLVALWQVIKHPRFYQIAPLSIATQGVFGAFVGLWSGYWLRDYLALSESQTAQIILTMAVAMTAGFVVLGALAAYAQRYGISAHIVSVSGVLVYMCSQWVIINQWSQWHHLWWGLGVVINLWPSSATGVYPQVAYATAWLWVLGLQVLALVWFFYNAVLSKLR